MTEQERAEWQQRLEAAVAETLRQRAARRRLREQHQAARDIGLRHRHRDRLTRARGEIMPGPQRDAIVRVDLSALNSTDLASLRSALARLAGWSSHTTSVLDALVCLTTQVARIRDERAGRPS